MRAEVTPWQVPPRLLHLRNNELHLWRFKLASEKEPDTDCEIMLSTEELLRADRLLDQRKRNQFIRARAYLKSILGKYLHVKPDQVQFQYNAYGKPSLSERHQSSLIFNLSHSGDWGVLAVCGEMAVGVDVEKIDPEIRFSLLGENYFNEREKLLLKLYSTPRKRRGFYRLWTQKEALLKLLGTGFRINNQNDVKFLQYTSFPLTAAYICSVAFKGKISRIKKIHLPDIALFHQ
ncbi:4'-phosphopantetheinyl transferase superfamily protein [uncultured Desulfuromusa sp.]|uniref:4'-phosphopantetheinyl transferase family protein n=1 Tax=uncultured Desulfuromusa sp. TaxID=219183 RepID=UPI002AA67A8E|nr:4'-phosphopantetheinyl transferase superfamily protein [uncultured Desulfuromusa sp.]